MTLHVMSELDTDWVVTKDDAPVPIARYFSMERAIAFAKSAAGPHDVVLFHGDSRVLRIKSAPPRPAPNPSAD